MERGKPDPNIQVAKIANYCIFEWPPAKKIKKIWDQKSF